MKKKPREFWITSSSRSYLYWNAHLTKELAEHELRMLELKHNSPHEIVHVREVKRKGKK